MIVQFRIINSNLPLDIYTEFSKYLYDKVLSIIEESANIYRLELREKYLLNSSIIKWRSSTKHSINLLSIIKDSIILIKDKNEYVITVDDKTVLPKSQTLVSTIVRFVEYGNHQVKAYPIIHTTFTKLNKSYNKEFQNFLQERVMR